MADDGTPTQMRADEVDAAGSQLDQQACQHYLLLGMRRAEFGQFQAGFQEPYSTRQARGPWRIVRFRGDHQNSMAEGLVARADVVECAEVSAAALEPRDQEYRVVVALTKLRTQVPVDDSRFLPMDRRRVEARVGSDEFVG
ncbi:hypothetical protein ASG87_13210 [Frateuria sp. Soil773]|nr:hypothetical protein ASG87_13210 [Frateuria sp. Soil773]